MGLRDALRRILGRRESREDHNAKKESGAERFREERATALGPDAYGHVEVDREFRRP